MRFRKTLLVGLCVASLGGLSVPIVASAEVGVFFNIAPPENRIEVVPAPRHGYLWSPGYWNAKGNNHHAWQAGHWERERAGSHFVQPGWTQHDNRWQLNRGHWDKG
jgi:WXXGXW repeat (2 copies)